MSRLHAVAKNSLWTYLKNTNFWTLILCSGNINGKPHNFSDLIALANLTTPIDFHKTFSCLRSLEMTFEHVPEESESEDEDSPHNQDGHYGLEAGTGDETEEGTDCSLESLG